jgi:cyclopropane-fatty-acyl-phospholipid synthase
MVFIQSLVLQHKMKVMTGNDWMGRNFFTGGQVPAMQSYLHYNEHLRVDELVSMTGKDYERTLNAWSVVPC